MSTSLIAATDVENKNAQFGIGTNRSILAARRMTGFQLAYPEALTGRKPPYSDARLSAAK
jgi:hypothetical protein